ncbi:hypothetical protein QAD02_010846 [Eretmocerus hayati]|uniref:Uncharacterized protein n=1 Tax=Eretmocerus hayati TaxID=131215 RepID=A0ACC2NZT6_9HYME|nr:hypothetical protein QAD02_010846 [Eretmocerus hayati]
MEFSCTLSLILWVVAASQSVPILDGDNHDVQIVNGPIVLDLDTLFANETGIVEPDSSTDLPAQHDRRDEDIEKLEKRLQKLEDQVNEQQCKCSDLDQDQSPDSIPSQRPELMPLPKIDPIPGPWPGLYPLYPAPLPAMPEIPTPWPGVMSPPSYPMQPQMQVPVPCPGTTSSQYPVPSTMPFPATWHGLTKMPLLIQSLMPASIPLANLIPESRVDSPPVPFVASMSDLKVVPRDVQASGSVSLPFSMPAPMPVSISSFPLSFSKLGTI